VSAYRAARTPFTPAGLAMVESGHTFAWLEELGIASSLVPDAPQEPGQRLPVLPLWMRVCYYTALNEGAPDLPKKQYPEEWADWRRFMLLLRIDNASQSAIEALHQIDKSKARAYVHDLKAEVLEKIQHAVFASQMTKRQGTRTRRLEGRIVGGFAGDEPPPRPSDEEFLLEALPPKRGQR